MSNAEDKQDAATLALWQAAEAGDFGELQAVLASVADVNARNEHGVTALMRAAQRGHARIVRLLLLHGADANIIRNDKFTALSLAAFFGHTEVVRTLMEHGADLNASTRHGTSPDMWATARTFNEVVDQLKEPATTPATAETTATPAIAATPVESRPVTAAIVRTLKDPPEIWDLVHEEPRGFKASSNFMDHLHSKRRAVLFPLATVAVLICVSLVGVLLFRGAQARSESERQQVENRSQPAPVTAPAAAVVPDAGFSRYVEPSVSPVETATMQRRRSHSSVVRFREIEGEPATRSVSSESVQRIQNQNEKTNVPNEKTNLKLQSNSGTKADSGNTVDTSAKASSTTKSSSPLSPQLINPAKNISPKSKVIQWP